MLKIDDLPDELLIEIISYYAVSKAELLRLCLVNSGFYDLVNCSEGLYHVLAKRDNILPFPFPKLYSNFREIYFEYENVGNPRRETFVYYNPEQLKWEISSAGLSILQQIQTSEICVVTLVDMTDNRASTFYNTLLGFSGAFDSRSKKRNSSPIFTPNLELWMKPFVFRSKQTEDRKTNVIFLKANGLLSHEADIDQRKTLMDFIMLFSSTLIVFKEEGDVKDWFVELGSLVPIQDEPSVFSHGDIDLRSLLVVNRLRKRRRSQNDDSQQSQVQVFDLLNEVREHSREKVIKTSFEDLISSSSSSSFFKQLRKEQQGEEEDGKKGKNEFCNTVRGKEKKFRKYPFLSCLTNWFGKMHGVSISFPDDDNRRMRLKKEKKEENDDREMFCRIREDVWMILYDLTKPLSFGWEMNGYVSPRNGTILSKYIEYCITKLNLRQQQHYSSVTSSSGIFSYQNLIFGFGKDLLCSEVETGLNFYNRAIDVELETASALSPYDMNKIVSLSEHYASTSLKMFTEQIKSLIFPYRTIREFENTLKNGITTIFRRFWLRNGEFSEKYCEKIFDSCFKWISAEIAVQGKFSEFESSFQSRFLSSLQLYLSLARGTRKYSVMSFCSSKYIESLREIYPPLKLVCDRLVNFVEKKTMQATLDIDRQRSYLQKLSAFKLKKLTIENSIVRLKEELNFRNLQQQKSEEWNNVVFDRILKLGLRYDERKRFCSFRKKIIQTCQEAIKLEKKALQAVEESIQEYEKRRHKYFHEGEQKKEKFFIVMGE